MCCLKLDWVLFSCKRQRKISWFRTQYPQGIRLFQISAAPDQDLTRLLLLLQASQKSEDDPE